MKILFDHLCFWQRFGGVARYFVELHRHLPAECSELTVRFSDNSYLREAGIAVHPFLGRWEFRGKARLEKQWGKIFSVARLLRRDYDIYHQTHYDCYAYRFLSPRVRRVTTLHDANFFTHASHYKPHSTLRRDMIRSAERADHIITVSHNSKRDICHFLGCHPSRVTVIYHGVDHSLCEAAQPFRTAERYIIYVGARSSYKNFARFCRSFAMLCLRDSTLRLYCCGSAPNSGECEMLRRLGIAERVRFYAPSDSELFSLYKSARCFVFPSLSEGFGLPVLEAMAAGCPVALSRRSCFPEVAGDAALYFNPDDEYDMCRVVSQAVEDEPLRERLVALGRLRASLFTWQRSADEHLSLYKQLLQ
ncbi:MAG: glycosyltransferase family 4 protein [Rikenellaceae bacterium]|nr:glycosyltransferase family 4 protein [Rikenellaceae bacterium]